MRVLEVGCGSGALARAMAARVAPGHVLGIDRSSPPKTSPAHLTRRPFDVIVAVRVGALDGRHPDAGARACARLAAVLAKGGRFVIDGVPHRPIASWDQPRSAKKSLSC